MSESDSTQSSDNNANTGNNTINSAQTAPRLNQESDNPGQNTHAYFIPLVMAIVISVIIVATFYSNEFNNLFAGVVTPDHGDELTSPGQEKLLTTAGAIDEFADTAETKANTASAAANKAADEVATTVVETAASDSSLIPAETPSSETITVTALSPGTATLASLDKQLPTSDSQYPNAYPYAPPMAHGLPEDYQNAYNEMMQQRRRSYDGAVQARREHLIKMHEYRAAVQKRIHQDRQDMYKRKQLIEQENQKRLDTHMNRVEQAEKRSMNRPI